MHFIMAVLRSKAVSLVNYMSTTRQWDVNPMFRTRKTWFELLRVKLYRNDLSRGNKNYFDLAGGSSYPGKITINVWRKSREIDFCSGYRGFKLSGVNCILKPVYPFSYKVYLSCLLIKLVWRNISLFLLQNRIHSSTHYTYIRVKF